MIAKWLSAIVGLLMLNVFAVLAQTEPTLYTNDAIDWQFVSGQKDYTVEHEQPIYFLNVTSDQDGNVYVANFWSILIFDAETGALQDAVEDNSGTIQQYDDVAVDVDGNLWVADSKTFMVYLLDSEGNVLQTIAANDPTDYMAPNELAIGPDGNLYVIYSSADTQMQVFTTDGEFVRSFTMGDRKLSTGLIGFAFGPDGNLYIGGVSTVRVLDTEGNMVVETFAQDFLEANPLAIRGIAVDADGNVYFGGTSEGDSITSAIYKLDADGQLLGQFGQAQQRMDWSSPFEPGDIGFTAALSLLPDGELLISDSNSGFNQLVRVDMTE